MSTPSPASDVVAKLRLLAHRQTCSTWGSLVQHNLKDIELPVYTRGDQNHLYASRDIQSGEVLGIAAIHHEGSVPTLGDQNVTLTPFVHPNGPGEGNTILVASRMIPSGSLLIQGTDDKGKTVAVKRPLGKDPDTPTQGEFKKPRKTNPGDDEPDSMEVDGEDSDDEYKDDPMDFVREFTDLFYFYVLQDVYRTLKFGTLEKAPKLTIALVPTDDVDPIGVPTIWYLPLLKKISKEFGVLVINAWESTSTPIFMGAIPAWFVTWSSNIVNGKQIQDIINERFENNVDFSTDPPTINLNYESGIVFELYKQLRAATGNSKSTTTLAMPTPLTRIAAADITGDQLYGSYTWFAETLLSGADYDGDLAKSRERTVFYAILKSMYYMAKVLILDDNLLNIDACLSLARNIFTNEYVTEEIRNQLIRNTYLVAMDTGSEDLASLYKPQRLYNASRPPPFSQWDEVYRDIQRSSYKSSISPSIPISEPVGLWKERIEPSIDARDGPYDRISEDRATDAIDTMASIRTALENDNNTFYTFVKKIVGPMDSNTFPHDSATLFNARSGENMYKNQSGNQNPIPGDPVSINRKLAVEFKTKIDELVTTKDGIIDIAITYMEFVGTHRNLYDNMSTRKSHRVPPVLTKIASYVYNAINQEYFDKGRPIPVTSIWYPFYQWCKCAISFKQTMAGFLVKKQIDIHNPSIGDKVEAYKKLVAIDNPAEYALIDSLMYPQPGSTTGINKKIDFHDVLWWAEASNQDYTKGRTMEDKPMSKKEESEQRRKRQSNRKKYYGDESSSDEDEGGDEEGEMEDTYTTSDPQVVYPKLPECDPTTLDKLSDLMFHEGMCILCDQVMSLLTIRTLSLNMLHVEQYTEFEVDESDDDDSAETIDSDSVEITNYDTVSIISYFSPPDFSAGRRYNSDRYRLLSLDFQSSYNFRFLMRLDDTSITDILMSKYSALREIQVDYGFLDPTGYPERASMVKSLIKQLVKTKVSVYSVAVDTSSVELNHLFPFAGETDLALRDVRIIPIQVPLGYEGVAYSLSTKYRCNGDPSILAFFENLEKFTLILENTFDREEENLPDVPLELNGDVSHLRSLVLSRGVSLKPTVELNGLNTTVCMIEEAGVILDPIINLQSLTTLVISSIPTMATAKDHINLCKIVGESLLDRLETLVIAYCPSLFPNKGADNEGHYKSLPLVSLTIPRGKLDVPILLELGFEDNNYNMLMTGALSLLPKLEILGLYGYESHGDVDGVFNRTLITGVRDDILFPSLRTLLCTPATIDNENLELFVREIKKSGWRLIRQIRDIKNTPIETELVPVFLCRPSLEKFASKNLPEMNVHYNFKEYGTPVRTRSSGNTEDNNESVFNIQAAICAQGIYFMDYVARMASLWNIDPNAVIAIASHPVFSWIYPLRYQSENGRSAYQRNYVPDDNFSHDPDEESIRYMYVRYIPAGVKLKKSPDYEDTPPVFMAHTFPLLQLSKIPRPGELPTLPISHHISPYATISEDIIRVYRSRGIYELNIEMREMLNAIINAVVSVQIASKGKSNYNHADLYDDYLSIASGIRLTGDNMDSISSMIKKARKAEEGKEGDDLESHYIQLFYDILRTHMSWISKYIGFVSMSDFPNTTEGMTLHEMTYQCTRMVFVIAYYAINVYVYPDEENDMGMVMHTLISHARGIRVQSNDLMYVYSVATNPRQVYAYLIRYYEKISHLVSNDSTFVINLPPPKAPLKKYAMVVYTAVRTLISLFGLVDLPLGVMNPNSSTKVNIVSKIMTTGLIKDTNRIIPYINTFLHVKKMRYPTFNITNTEIVDNDKIYVARLMNQITGVEMDSVNRDRLRMMGVPDQYAWIMTTLAPTILFRISIDSTFIDAVKDINQRINLVYRLKSDELDSISIDDEKEVNAIIERMKVGVQKSLA